MKLAAPPDLPATVSRALAEDIGDGDLTAMLVPADRRSSAQVITREACVLAGTPYADEVFRQVGGTVEIQWDALDGESLQPGQVICRLSGPSRQLLTGERTALNFLQTLSGPATETARYVAAVAGTGCTVLDTRKTLPGLRLAQKYAVRCGGGRNHRLGLYDGVLIKENHIAAAGSIAAAVAAARALPRQVPVEVETESLDELREALEAGADVVMLDDFTLEDMRVAVTINRAHARPAKLEASGSVDLSRLRAIAATGVDYVSVGGLTKHVRAIDLSMRFE
jgi:nicotinate-nucleotide pyrophosphorylase (carboxylating)